MKKLSFILIIILLAGNCIYPQDDAGQPGEFLRYGVNARALGMGRAFTAVTNNANAIYWNPGGLYNIIRDGLSFTLMYSELYESTTYNFTALAVPIELLLSADAQNGIAQELKRWNIGFGYLALSSDGFEVRNHENQTTGESFSDQQSAIYFSLTRGLSVKNHQFGLGVNYKILTHKLFNHEANTAAIDIGLKYQPTLEWLEFGANIQNINSPDFRFTQGGSDQIPSSTRLGVAVKPRTAINFLDSFIFSFDFMAVPPGKRDRDWFFGAEYDFLSSLFHLPMKIRFGYNSREHFAFGINLDLPNNIYYTEANQILPKLDWAYLPNQQNPMGNLSKRFSIDYSYTPFTSERWYKRGIEKFKDDQYNLAKEDLSRALHAKNPKKMGYRPSAALRLGDIEVILSENKVEGIESALQYYRRTFQLEKIRHKINPELNYVSYINFLQGLFLKERFEDVIKYTTADSIWGHHNTQNDRDKTVICFRSWAYYHLNQQEKAIQSLETAQEFPLCEFLQGLIQLEKENYPEARDTFSRILQSKEKGIPDHIIVSPFEDRLLLDDSQFLHAYAGYKLNESEDGRIDPEYLLELAQIQRLYPASSINSFLQENDKFDRLIDPNKSRDDELFDNLYRSYLKTIKQGMISRSTLIANLR